MHKNKKVLLINPPPSLGWNYRYKFSYGPPLGLLSIGTVLRQKGYQMRIIDGAQDENYILNIKNEITSSGFSFIGISVMTAQIPMALELSRAIKKSAPNNLVVWGGVHPTLFPAQVCADDFVDIVVIGEGEFTAVELAESIVLQNPLDKIKGIAYKKGAEVVINASRPQADINTLPFFDYDLLDVEYYIVKDRSDVGGRYLEGGHVRRSLPILSGLGCPYNCKFCIESVLRKKYRRRDVVDLVGEVKRLIANYEINEVSFVDDLFFADKKWFFEFLDLIESTKLKFYWGANVRADYFNQDYLNLKLLKRMRNLGCYHLGLGAESGSERILNKIDKKIKKSDVMNAARLCKESNINLAFSFMIALPGETQKEMMQTIKFAYELASVNPRNSHIIGPNIYRPYPGSAILEEAVKEYGFQLPVSLEKWGDVYSHNEGYFKLERLPWVKHPFWVRVYCFYLFRATTNFVYPNALVNYFAGLLKLISRVRVRFCFYNFPLEYMFIENTRAITVKIRL